MTKATTEGRQLVLTVEGVDTPFRVDPLPAKRGKALTELFLAAALGQLSGVVAEAIFIESIGPSNYSRMSGLYVDEYDRVTGAYLRTWDPEGSKVHSEFLENESEASFMGRDRVEALDEPDLDGEPIRQEEAEALCLAAFYWQTVVGMEAVSAFINAGEGTEGSLKALSLLQVRMGLSPSTTSRSSVLENAIQQQAASKATSTPQVGKKSVRLPADRQKPRNGKKKSGNPAKQNRP